MRWDKPSTSNGLHVTASDSSAAAPVNSLKTRDPSPSRARYLEECEPARGHVQEEPNRLVRPLAPDQFRDEHEVIVVDPRQGAGLSAERGQLADGGEASNHRGPIRASNRHGATQARRHPS